MRKLFTFLAAVLLTASVFAQSPEKMSYQAVIRDASNNLVTNQTVGIQISILQGSVSGTVVYTETQTPTTNDNGLLSIEFGGGVGFDTIDWANGPYFIKTETDPTGDSTYTITGTSQLLSVPYAFHAKTAVSITGAISETQDLSDVLVQGNNGSSLQIKNIADPTDNQDVATKSYVDGLITILQNNGVSIINADFTANNTSIVIGENVSFTDLSENATNWEWSFGDGDSSTEQNPTHTYNSPGTYSVSLIATNSYGSDAEIKTDFISVTTCPLTVVDVEGNTYNTIEINGQCWMKENLKVTKYPDGTLIPHVSDNTAWANLASNNTDDAYCFYNNNVNNEADTYGALYTWAAAMGDSAVSSTTTPSGVQGVCPDGWHLPSMMEFQLLINYFGGTSDAGIHLRESGTSHWDNPNTATNSSGFTALPGGLRQPDTGLFEYMGGYGWFMTTTNTRISLQLEHDYDGAGFTVNADKSTGFSVRCLKDY